MRWVTDRGLLIAGGADTLSLCRRLPGVEPGSPISQGCRTHLGWARAAGLSVLEEAFADRRYLQNGRLAPRSQAGAVIEDAAEVMARARAIALGQPVTAIGGAALNPEADTLCLHGEGPQAAKFAEEIRAVLRKGST